MSGEEYHIGIRINYGSVSYKFRDAQDIKVKNNILTFGTVVKCLGNNFDEDGRRVRTQLDPSTYAGLEECIPNPILMRYESAGPRTTKVTVYLNHVEEYEVFPGY